MDRSLRIRMLLEAGDRVTRPLRDIAQGSTRAAQALRATRDRLKELERAQSDVAGFRALKTGLAQTGSAMEAARARATALGRELAQTGQPSRALARDFARAKQEAERLTRQHEAETRQLGELRDRLSRAGIETSGLARHERDLRQSIDATNRELAEQERRLTGAADRARRFADGRARFGRVQHAATGLAASGASGIAAGMALGRPILGAIGEAREYESVMTDIAQKANLSRAHAKVMGSGLLVAARAANQMPDELQKGVDTLAGFGLDPRRAVAMMRPIGRAATAYKAEIADLSAAAFAANDNLKVPVEQTARVIDIMAQAGKSGAFEIKDMAGAFPALTAGYQALGQTGTGAVADLAAALQIARKGAGDSATAANNVGNIIQKIASPATIKAFSKFGIDLPAALKKAYADGKTPLEAIAELTEKATKGDLGKIGFLFEDAQVQQGLRPLIQNLEEYRRIRAEAAGATGTTDTDFAERMNDAAEKTKALEVKAKTLGITLGTMLLPTWNAITEVAGRFADWVGGMAERYPNLTKGIVIGTAAFAALFLVIGGGAIAIAALMAPFAALSFVAGAFGIGLLPVIGIALGVVAGIVALGAAAYMIYANWGAIGAWFGRLWEGIKANFSTAIAAVTAGLVNFSPVGLLYSGFAALMGWLGIRVPAQLSEIGGMLIMGLIRGITGRLGALKATIVNAASAAANWFKEKMGIRSPSRVFMTFGGFMTAGLADGIDRGAQAPVARLRGVVRDMDAIAGRALRVPAIGDAPRIDASRRLRDTAATITAAIGVGAMAPAIAAPVPRAPQADASRAAAPRAGNTFNIYQRDGESGEDLARRIADAIDRHDREADARSRSSFRDVQDYGSLD